VNDAGETLIELIIAVAIMGIAVVAIVGGIATSIMMSDIHRKQTTAGAYVRSYAEAVQAYVAAGNFDAGASPKYGPSKVLPSSWATFLAPNTGFNSPKISVQCWNGTAFDNSCGSGTTVQKVTLTVSSTDSRASESLVVVVRKQP